MWDFVIVRLAPQQIRQHCCDTRQRKHEERPCLNLPPTIHKSQWKTQKPKSVRHFPLIPPIDRPTWHSDYFFCLADWQLNLKTLASRHSLIAGPGHTTGSLTGIWEADMQKMSIANYGLLNACILGCLGSTSWGNTKALCTFRSE